MRTKHIVVIGTSSGGIEALRDLARALPQDFPAPICVVLHTSPQAPGILDSILSRAGRLPATNAKDRERLKGGHIYVAPPDCHLLVEPGIVRVTKGPRENRFRPAIDPLFRSAAQVYGPAAIGVVLTGNLDDGTAGLWAIKQLGGTTIVQDPADALFPGMPQSALDHVKVDHLVPLADLAPLLSQLTSAVLPEAPPAAPLETLEVEVKIAKEESPLRAGLQEIAEPSMFACPECHGVLLKLKEGGPIRFRCHTGHAYSLETLLSGINEGIEEALWSSVRALEEGEMLLQAMSEHFQSHNQAQGELLRGRAREAHDQAEALRRLILARDVLSPNSSTR